MKRIKAIWNIMPPVIITVLLTTVLLLGAFESKALAGEPKTWYVDDNLQDYPDADFTQIQDAVDAASAGLDTIIVYPGTYTENVNVNKDHLTIKSEKGAETTIVQAANPDDHVFEIKADYVNISGFTVKGVSEFSKAGVYLGDDVNYCIISNNNVSNNNYGIYIEYSALTNKGTKQLTSSSLWQSNPTWSPDGTKILYQTSRDAPFDTDIWVMNTDGSNKIQLTNNPRIQAYPSWSPDGTKIVYASDQSGNREIWIMNADGSNKIQLTTTVSWRATHPTWSLDGTKIIYEMGRGGYETHNVDIWIMNADGTGKTQLTSGTHVERLYSISTTGKITYEKYMGNYNWDIWVMNLDGSNKKQLTTDPSQETGPLISPDGSKIAYSKGGASGYV